MSGKTWYSRRIWKKIEDIELPAKLLDHFLRSTNSNINQKCTKRLQTPELCILEQHQCWDSKNALAHGPWIIPGYVGKRKGVGEGYLGLRKCVQWSPSVGGAKCGWSRWTEKKCGASSTCISFSHSHCHDVVPGVLACVHMFMLWGGRKTAPDRCFICLCRQVYTRGLVLLTLRYILVTTLITRCTYALV